LNDDDARVEIERARAETGLPCDDLVRFDAEPFYTAIRDRIVKTAPLTAPAHT
jgi:hypothetical protein